MGPLMKVDVPDGIGDAMEGLTRAILSAQPEDIYEFAVKHFEELISIRDAAQASGVSPSSTTESATKAPVLGAPLSSRPPSIGNVSTGKSEEPQSNDTSFGVEASAVRQLAAETGTLAIYSSTTCNSPVKEQEETPVIEEPPEVALEEKTAESLESNEVDSKDVSRPDSAPVVRQVPQITETLVASLDPSPSDENEKEIPARYSPDGGDQSSADFSGKTEVTKSTECSDDQPANQPKLDESKSDNNESNSTKTFENDISSEQLKTNSLSDLSFSELDEKDLPKVVEVVERRDFSGESETHSEPKLVEITPDSTSESSQQITKEESTSDITTDHQTEDVKAEQDEEPLLNSGADESIELDADGEKQKVAAIRIQSSFRGYQVRKTRSTKPEEDDPKLTESEIENVKTQVDDIIKEAEVKTESLRNTPDIDEEINAAPEEEFPAPPDDLQLSQLERDDSRDQDKDISLNIDPVPYPIIANEESSTEPIPENASQNSQEHSPHENDENTSAELARMTADEDLPAPDLELLESSCTDDLNTELAVPEKVLDEDPRDSTEGDVTISEDSEELKVLQKPQECDDGVMPPNPSEPAAADENLAATKIQANVRGFLTRKQTQKGQKSEGPAVVSLSEDSTKNADSVTVVVESAQAEQQQPTNESSVKTQSGVTESTDSTSVTSGSDAFDEKENLSADNVSETTLEADLLESYLTMNYSNSEITPSVAVEDEKPNPNPGSEVMESSSTADVEELASTVEGRKPGVEEQKPDSSNDDVCIKIKNENEKVSGNEPDYEDSLEPTIVEDEQVVPSVIDDKSGEEPTEAQVTSEENISSKSEVLENSERIEFSNPSPSHDPPRGQAAQEDGLDKVSSTSESLSQDTTSTSQNTVEENPLAAQKPSADEDKLDDVFESQTSSSKELGKSETVSEEAREGGSGNVETMNERNSPQTKDEPVTIDPEPAKSQPNEGDSQEKPVANQESTNDPDPRKSQNDSVSNEKGSDKTLVDFSEDPGKEVLSLGKSSPIKASELLDEGKESPAPENVPDMVTDTNESSEKLIKSIVDSVPQQADSPSGTPSELVQNGSGSFVENGSDNTKEHDEILNASATKIQANIRGYLTRKHQTNKAKD